VGRAGSGRARGISAQTAAALGCAVEGRALRRAPVRAAGCRRGPVQFLCAGVISELPEWARKAFAGMRSLNRIQSRVCNAALFSAENLLLCAPTGAGKTNVAMLAILHEARARPTRRAGAGVPGRRGRHWGCQAHGVVRLMDAS